MTIRKRLILSNLAMVFLPITGMLGLEIIMGVVMFRMMNLTPADSIGLFTQVRFIGMIGILIVTNGMLTYYVSKTILTPANKLNEATKKLAAGERDFAIQVDRSDELGELARSFEEMRRKLKEAEALEKKYEAGRKELIASISHDLKTPITSIKGYMMAIRDGVADTPEKQQRYVSRIIKKTEEMDHLINELFLYSKLDVNRVPFHFEKVDLAAYFGDYLEEVRFEHEDIETEIVESGESFHVKADRKQIHRVVTNLIQNSLKFIDKEKKQLNVSLSEKGPMVVVKISDNGPGIPGEAIPFIFDQFYQGDAARSKSLRGSGLGLAISKKIIELHGGEIHAESGEGKGTTMAFTLERWEVTDG
ncbi:sensor histidine kinase [Halobacillus karajensis]|uniref:histidine kinase n=1 Tax=Halobacillus karajensis TaxID=195088 RepID=A0A059NXF4_9BACI|nr:HAMP domain-containing sensor histidine kinase [Halobacillus karajensis]CDQ18468.1 Sensor histidine kinase YycG [Halobacillus karajensis]CDQ23460.1 Sensor histidine kinase YycG [Halobacillus karajensis]CDQ26942.1 Sensor histidine kinase YycG [Halobacillus karajensis]